MDIGGLSGNIMSGAMKYIEGLNFPASKQEIIAHVKSKNAPGPVVMGLEKLPDQVYDSASAVASKLGL